MHTTNTSVVETKQFFASLRQLINSVIGLLVFCGSAYILFWIGIMCDSIILDSGVPIFNPLATLFFPNNNSFEIYRNTGLILMALTIPVTLLYGIAYSFEQTIVNNIYKKEEKDEQKRAQKEFLESLKEYSVIDVFSICLSIDYESKKEFSSKNKAILNKGIYETLKKAVLKVLPTASVDIDNVMVIHSKDFAKYDKTYDTILKTLAEIKPKLEQRYGFNLVPSITTDAYAKKEKVSNIKRNHFGIQSFNFKNRACTTATFAKKYTHLKMRKYAGIPIGEYIVSNTNNSYELNIIHKNLTQTLASYQ